MFSRLLLLFLALPLIELFFFLLIGQEIGIIATFGIILLTGVLGATLARRQGLKTLAKYREAVAAGRLPHEAVVDGLLIFAAGTLLLTPGFFTDTIGFLLLVPGVRGLVRKRLEKSLRERIHIVVPGAAQTGPMPKAHGVAHGGVITVEAEVVESHAHRKNPAP